MSGYIRLGQVNSGNASYLGYIMLGLFSSGHAWISHVRRCAMLGQVSSGKACLGQVRHV